LGFLHNRITFFLKLVSKFLDLGREQGAIRFESGAHTAVREHFESDRNAAIGQEMNVLKPVSNKFEFLSQYARFSQPYYFYLLLDIRYPIA
jgi:hypothetical protein